MGISIYGLDLSFVIGGLGFLVLMTISSHLWSISRTLLRMEKIQRRRDDAYRGGPL